MCLEDRMDRKIKKSYRGKWYIIGESNHYILRIRQSWENCFPKRSHTCKSWLSWSRQQQHLRSSPNSLLREDRGPFAIGVSIGVERHVFAIHHWQTCSHLPVRHLMRCSITYLLYRLSKTTATPSPTSRRSWFDPSLTWNATPSFGIRA